MLYPIKPVLLTGKIHQDLDLSGLAILNNLMFLGSDESKKKLTVLEHQNSLGLREDYAVKHEINLPVSELSKKEEIDIEGLEITADGHLYVVASHSLNRKRVKLDKTQQKNRERILEVEKEQKRFFLFQLRIDPKTGELLDDSQKISLEKVFTDDPLLAPFTEIPSKENGVDLEAIAVSKQKLYLGFRSPVLRLNYVPVLVTRFDNPSDYEILYLDLKGNGIRDMTKVEAGFLIIAGPPNDMLSPYYLYFWDGRDGMIGSDQPGLSVLTLLGEIPTPIGAKAEGIAVTEETSAGYTFMIIYDSISQGGATLFYASKTPDLIEFIASRKTH